MNRKTRKSSRSRMTHRRKSKPHQTPAEAEVEVKKHGYVVGKVKVPNRAKKRLDKAWRRGAPGRSAREEQKNKRQIRLKKLRQVTNAISREARRILRVRLGA